MRYTNTKNQSKDYFLTILVHQKYVQLEETLVDEQSRVLNILEEQYSKNIGSFAKIYESEPKIRLAWNLNTPIFEASLH